jgi:hypothetical protein
MRELNRLGVTSVIEAGGGFQNYPDDYAVIEQLHRDDQLTLRIAYNLFTQKPKGELADFQSWAKVVKPGQGDDYFRHNGAARCWSIPRQTLKTFSNRVRTWLLPWRTSCGRSLLSWRRTAGLSAFTLPTTKLSIAR